MKRCQYGQSNWVDLEHKRKTPQGNFQGEMKRKRVETMKKRDTT